MHDEDCGVRSAFDSPTINVVYLSTFVVYCEGGHFLDCYL
jgi:hypothetical protein